MQPVSPVLPGSKYVEVILAKDQPQYRPLPVICLDIASRPMISRWRFSDEEREEITGGADIVLTQLTFGNLFQPISLQVLRPDEMPVLPEE